MTLYDNSSVDLSFDTLALAHLFVTIKDLTPNITPSLNVQTMPIRLTYYYTGDNTGSGQCTASGRCTYHFDVNDLGWYTYKGYVVLAAATYRCLNAQSGVCGKYTSIPKNYNIHHLFETVYFTNNNMLYEGIILDSCGACMHNVNGETIQRYDVFTRNPSTFSVTKPDNVSQIIIAELIH